MKVKESLNVTLDESPPPPITSPLEDDDLVEEEAIKVIENKPLGNDIKNELLENDEIINIKESKIHPLENVIGDLNQRTLRSQVKDKIQAVEATDDSPAVPEHTTVETPMNMSPENKDHFLAKKEAIHLILTGIGDEIYSTVDACQTAQEMLEAIERFYMLMNEMIRNNLTVTTMQFNVQFLQQLQPEWYRHKGKEIAKPITPPSETASEDDNNPEQAQRDKDMQKNLALIAKYFKKIYKPTNNNLRTSSNSRNKNVDMTPWYKNDDHSRQFGNQRTVNVARAREKVGSPVVQQSGIQCFNCKEYGHFAKECRNPKRVKDFAYHKEKMLLCKQAEQEQYDWLADMDEEVDEQELETPYSYMAKIQEVPNADSGTDSEPVEQTNQTEFEKYKAFNGRTVDYDKHE
nr:retrovirus-related Pol polyprotein from transposon TNT 1-94 [Tanacetum cinerariifolium]